MLENPVHKRAAIGAAIGAVVAIPLPFIGPILGAIVGGGIGGLALGAALLWVGWFGFNAGSALAADGVAASAFAATHFSAAAGTLAWAGIEWFLKGKPTVLGACSGAVAGLVCITPASGFVTPMPAIFMGAAAGLVCYFACTTIKSKFGYDDSLDAFGVHGMGGAWGALASGIFATSLGAGVESNGAQILVQLKSIGFTAVFAPVMTLGILLVLKMIFGSLRVADEAEFEGLDISEHSESAYSLGSGASVGLGAHGSGSSSPAFPATAAKTA